MSSELLMISLSKPSSYQRRHVTSQFVTPGSWLSNAFHFLALES